jgi:hypothetical protein
LSHRFFIVYADRTVQQVGYLESVASLVDRRAKEAERRRRIYSSSKERAHTTVSELGRWSEQHVTRTSSLDHYSALIRRDSGITLGRQVW